MSDMLEKYTLKYKGKNAGKKEYNLSLKVAKDVEVTFKEIGNINEVYLRYDSTAQNENFEKTLKLLGNLIFNLFSIRNLDRVKEVKLVVTQLKSL